MAFGGLDDVGDGLYTRRTDRDFTPVKSEQFFLGQVRGISSVGTRTALHFLYIPSPAPF